MLCGVILPSLLFVFIAAFVWAKLEIEIEGKDGWAANLPTWRIENHVLLDLFLGGRPLTGYHAWAFTFAGLVFHFPFFWNGSWTWRAECHALGYCLLFWIIEDFLWFVLNPHFGWSKYKEGSIWWHKRWFLKLPLDYWVLTLMGALLIWLP
jgi:hypothetical protein